MKKEKLLLNTQKRVQSSRLDSLLQSLKEGLKRTCLPFTKIVLLSSSTKKVRVVSLKKKKSLKKCGSPKQSKWKGTLLSVNAGK